MRYIAPLLALAAAATAATAAAQTAPTIQLTGEVRARGELDARSADSLADAAALLRSRLGARVTVSPQARAFVQVQDARAFGEEESTTDASAATLDVHQAWLEMGDTVAGRLWTARLGRQELVFGDERLVGAAGWTNTGRAFDATRVQTGALNLFAASVREHDRVGPGGLDPRANEGTDADHAFGGVYLDARRGDLYLLHDRGAASAVRDDIDRTTMGGRVDRAAPAGLLYEAEAAYQFGSQRVTATGAEQDVSAWFAVGRVGWAFGPGPLRSVRAGADWLSGDDDAADEDYRAFNPLYGTNHKFYGTIDFFLDPAANTGGRGLVDVLAGATVAPHPRFPVDVAVHRFSLAEAVDGERHLGWEMDVTLPFTAAQGVRALAGYSAFRTGDAAPAAGLPRDGEWLHWGFVQLSIGF